MLCTVFPTDVLADLQKKCEEYIDTVSGVAVLLNPRDRSVALYRKGYAPIPIRDADTVAVGSETPGFVLNARAVFQAAGRALYKEVEAPRDLSTSSRPLDIQT